MSWTVIKEDENGNTMKAMSKEFHLSNVEIFYTCDFRILKYIDLYGDTTINSNMVADLICDLKDLLVKLPTDKEEIQEVIELATECQGEVHTYLKFYGD